MTPSTRVERKRAQALHRIREAGRDLLIKNGYEHTTVEMISEHADVSTGAFYTHYESKLALAHYVVSEAYRSFRELGESLIADKATGAEQLRSLVKGLVDTYLRGDSRFILLRIGEHLHSDSSSPGVTDLTHESSLGIFDLIQRIIQRGAEDHTIAVANVRERAFVILMYLRNFLYSLGDPTTISTRYGMDAKELLNEATEVLLCSAGRRGQDDQESLGR